MGVQFRYWHTIEHPMTFDPPTPCPSRLAVSEEASPHFFCSLYCADQSSPQGGHIFRIKQYTLTLNHQAAHTHFQSIYKHTSPYVLEVCIDDLQLEGQLPRHSLVAASRALAWICDSMVVPLLFLGFQSA